MTGFEPEGLGRTDGNWEVLQGEGPVTKLLQQFRSKSLSWDTRRKHLRDIYRQEL